MMTQVENMVWVCHGEGREAGDCNIEVKSIEHISSSLEAHINVFMFILHKYPGEEPLDCLTGRSDI